MPNFKTSLLEISYSDDGPGGGPVVLLLHGWPDDATTWSQVSTDLNAVGFRTIAPMHRGFGPTRFLEETTPRVGNPARLALDALELLDGLKVDRFIVAGHDWGSSTAEALAVGWPDRVEKIAMLSTPPRRGGLKTPSFEQAQRYWYQWFQATKRGEAAIAADPKGFARMQWETWSPSGWFSEETFARVAQSFENPDWVKITLHAYRSRWGEDELDASSAWLEEKIRGATMLSTPTLFIQGAADGVTPPSQSQAIAPTFSGPFERIILNGVGHFPTREAPHTVAKHLVSHFAR